MSRLVPLFFALAGCSNAVQFTDDLDFRVDLRRAVGPDGLHTPYVEGTEATLTVTAWKDLDKFEIVNLSPELIELETVLQNEDEIVLSARTLAAGTAELEVRRRDRVVDGVSLEIGRPDRAELHAAGGVFAMLGDGFSETVDPVLLRGGLATYEVRWFEGGERLFGNGVLTTGATGLDAWADQTYLFENREWLRIEDLGGTDGGEVVLGHLGRPVATHRVDLVERADIVSLEVLGDGEQGAEPGDTITLLGDARTAEGVPVHGAEYTWERDAIREIGSGDMYRYTFDPDAPTELTASFDGLMDGRSIRGLGEVTSSNHIGCASVGWTGSAGLALLPLLFVRRRQSAA